MTGAAILRPLDVNMTVEEYISNFVELLKNNIREKNVETKTRLDLQFEKSKRQLLGAHSEVLAALEPHHKHVDDDVPMQEDLSTNQNNVERTTAPRVEKPAAAQSKGLHVEVLSGPHKGATFQLDPRVRAPCFIGRSAGKKFTERGMSLSSDLEVSTTHGKFELKKGSYLYTDQSSTNGSYFKGKLMEPFEPLQLVDGMIFTVGTSDLKITF